jgi:galactose mutarotase-like enzyme
MIQIENNHLTASICPQGAELQSLKLKHNQHEMIWQRDPDIWSGSAPVLFPIVGRLIDGQYIHDGKIYTMPTHGIVRTEPWTVVDKAKTHVTLEIGDSEGSRQCYPFRWKLAVRFELTELQLVVRYCVTNLDTRTLFFSLGSHPAFNLDFGSSCISDYTLRTDNSGPPWRRRKVLDGKLSNERFEVDWRGHDLPLSETLFDEDALIFTGIRCKQLILLNARDPRQIVFDTGGAPDLGIWAKRRAPYVCIEPWYGYDDPENHHQQLSTKPGIQTLEKSGVFTTAYSIGLNAAWL